jgi:hypothetical protein
MHTALVRTSVRVNASARPLSRLADRANRAPEPPFLGRGSRDIIAHSGHGGSHHRHLAALSVRGRRALLLTAASFLVSISPARAAVDPSSTSPFTSTGAAPDPSSCEPVGRAPVSFSPVRTKATMGGDGASGDTDGTLAEYPGTALTRMENAVQRASSLTEAQLSGDWEDVRGKLLWAAGLRDIRDARPGDGYTGHCFNDFNHVDATTMTLDVSDNENRGAVQGIAFGNRLGPGIKVASDPTLGPGGTWCTCAQGGNAEPPADVAHLQFRSKIAWKLVWVPAGGYTRFVLVDDAGTQLATGTPTGQIPAEQERKYNYEIVKGGRYAKAADAYAA